jgi:hypothetical protein
MRLFGKSSPSGKAAVGTFGQIRVVAALTAGAALLAPTATTAGLLLAFLLGWFLIFRWLLPAPRQPDEIPTLGPAEAKRARTRVGELARAVVRARIRDSLTRDLRKGLADEHPTAQEQETRVNRAARLAGAPTSPRADQVEALSSYQGLSPWRRAIDLSLAGTVIGLPWSIIDLSTVIRTLDRGSIPAGRRRRRCAGCRTVHHRRARTRIRVPAGPGTYRAEQGPESVRNHDRPGAGHHAAAHAE